MVSPMISLTLESLSTMGDSITRTDLKARLLARQEEKRLAAEAARAAKEEAQGTRLFGGMTDILKDAIRP